MAEAAGLALGVIGLAGLFSNCLDCFHLIQTGLSLDKDYKLLETKLRNQELRLCAWGAACRLDDQEQYDSALDEPVLLQRIKETLECIQQLFNDGKRLRKRYGLKPWKGTPTGEQGDASSSSVVASSSATAGYHIGFTSRFTLSRKAKSSSILSTAR